MQRAVNRFEATSAIPEEVAPRQGALFPRFAACTLPIPHGGLGLLELSTQLLSNAR
jgi:hypothetical protein